MALAYRLAAISTLSISRAKPPITSTLVMKRPASKTLRTGPYKSLVHRWFYEHENPLIGLRGPVGSLLEREYEAVS